MTKFYTSVRSSAGRPRTKADRSVVLLVLIECRASCVGTAELQAHHIKTGDALQRTLHKHQLPSGDGVNLVIEDLEFMNDKSQLLQSPIPSTPTTLYLTLLGTMVREGNYDSDARALHASDGGTSPVSEDAPLEPSMEVVSNLPTPTYDEVIDRFASGDVFLDAVEGDKVCHKIKLHRFLLSDYESKTI